MDIHKHLSPSLMIHAWLKQNLPDDIARLMFQFMYIHNKYSKPCYFCKSPKTVQCNTCTSALIDSCVYCILEHQYYSKLTLIPETMDLVCKLCAQEKCGSCRKIFSSLRKQWFCNYCATRYCEHCSKKCRICYKMMCIECDECSDYFNGFKTLNQLTNYGNAKNIRRSIQSASMD